MKLSERLAAAQNGQPASVVATTPATSDPAPAHVPTHSAGPEHEPTAPVPAEDRAPELSVTAFSSRRLRTAARAAGAPHDGAADGGADGTDTTGHTDADGTDIDGSDTDTDTDTFGTDVDGTAVDDADRDHSDRDDSDRDDSDRDDAGLDNAAARPPVPPGPARTAIPNSGALVPVEAHRSGPRTRFVDPLAAIKRTVHQSLLEALGPTLYDAQLAEVDLATRVRLTLQTVIDAEQTLISTADRVRITDEVLDEILGHGPIEPFLRDPSVTEIMVNGHDRIYVEKAGRLHAVPAAFTDDNHLRRTIEKIVSRVGRRIDEASPMVDARLPDGSRVNAVLPPIALDGPMLTVRKFSADPLTVHDLVGHGTLTATTANLLAACVRGRLNILISGGTGSGKTTTLNVLSSFVPENERIVTIEDAAELQLRQDHVVRMESRPSNVEGRGEITTRELVRNSLRMRPDRVIVGEVRDGAALDMLQAMNTGHDGSLTTLHANGPRDALSRLETMVLMAGVDLPTRAIREQAASAIDVIVHQSRLRDGTRRITHITEVLGMESEVVTLQDLFLFDYAAGVDEDGRFLGGLRSTGIRPHFVERLADQGITIPISLFTDQP